MRLLALDAATRTGFAAKIDDKVTFGHIDIAALCSKKASRGERLGAARCAYGQLIADRKPDLVILEAPFSRGLGTRLLYGFAAAVEELAHKHGAACIELEPSWVRKHILGSAKLPDGKATVIQWARDQGYTLTDEQDDEADALLLLHAGFDAAHVASKPKRKRAA